MADQVNINQEIAQVEWDEVPQLEVNQILAQVEWDDPGKIRIQQNLAQVEWVPAVHIIQVVAQVEISNPPFWPGYFEFGHKIGYLDTDDRVAGPTGTLHTLTGARKKTYELQFSCCTQAHLDRIIAVWQAKQAVELYLYNEFRRDLGNMSAQTYFSDYEATVKIMRPPEAQSVAAFEPSTGEPLYNFDLYMEEI